MNIPVCINVEQFVVPVERVFHFHAQSGTPLPAVQLSGPIAQRDIEIIHPNQFTRYSRRRDRHPLRLGTSRKQKPLLQIHRIGKLLPDAGEIAGYRMTARARAIEIRPSRIRVARQDIQRLHRIAIYRGLFDLLFQEVCYVCDLHRAQPGIVTRQTLQRGAQFAPQTIAHHQRRPHQVRPGVRALTLFPMAIRAALRINSPTALRRCGIHLLSRQRTGLAQEQPAC